MAKQNYSVTVTGWITVLVMGAEDEDQAIDLARDEIPSEMQTDEWKTEVIRDNELEAHRRHADAIVEEED